MDFNATLNSRSNQLGLVYWIKPFWGVRVFFKVVSYLLKSAQKRRLHVEIRIALGLLKIPLANVKLSCSLFHYC